VGLGRVVFTSFPVDALDHSNPRTAALWNRLLNLDAPPAGWSHTALAQECGSVLETMIGVPSAPGSLAMGVVGGYALLMLLVQLAIGGARRPLAFALGTGIAVALFAGLVMVSLVRKEGRRDVSGARLAVVELGDSGGGVVHEALALFGRDETELSLRTTLHGTMRPALSTMNNPPTIEQLPFAAPNAGVRSGRIERVWQASAAADAENVLSAVLQFAGDGVRLETDNQTGQALIAPLLVWNQYAYRLTNLAPGRSATLLGPSNPQNDYSNALLFTGEEVGLRSRIVKLSRSARTDIAAVAYGVPPPMLVGWLEPSAASLAKPIIESSAVPQPLRAQVMCRVPIRLQPSRAGETIRIPAEFVKTVVDTQRGAPYDAERQDWVPSLLAGNWNIGFQIPQGIGSLSSVHATVHADLAAPAHTVILRRTQPPTGAEPDASPGAAVAEWDQPVGNKIVKIDLQSTDLDAAQVFWLRLGVDPSRSNTSGEEQWKINDLSVEFVGQVTEAKEAAP
jgi:hypothetical protein